MRFLLLLPALICSLTLSAQKWSRVKIILDANHNLAHLAKMGLDIEHGFHQPYKYFTGEFSQEEISQIQAAGFQINVLIPDLQFHLQEMNEKGLGTLRNNVPCFTGHTSVQTPANYTYGSMGGYFTYQEMLDLLDQMATMYPAIFKARAPISTTLKTIEGREMYWIKVSDNPNVDESDEPEVLYTALHHAREPNSLSQMIFYLWFLLENYDTDPEIKYLVDHTEMYFVPCINPDGYVYNETTNPSGGGYWRKNRRENGNGSMGVDLNRNYGFKWGFNDNGSSGNPDSEIYRGTAAFSEPETQLIKEFCEAHEFQIALNYHTYSNLLLHPWDYDFIYTPDHNTFTTMAALMTAYNNYTYGTAFEILYPVNGGSNDWMYADTTAKPKIFAFVPEVGPGSTGFWPPQSDIDGLNKDALYMNLTAARLLLNYGELTPSYEPFLTETNGKVNFDITRLGLKNGPLSVSLVPLSDNVSSVSPGPVYNLQLSETSNGEITFSLDPNIQDGDTILFELRLDNGASTLPYPITIRFSKEVTSPVIESGEDITEWLVQGNWAQSTATYYTPPFSITDSPSGNYVPSSTTSITLDDPVKIKDAISAKLTFFAKWEIEEDEDFAQAMISVNGAPFTPLCGKYTEAGTINQVLDEPLYDGNQITWVKEEIDLTEYLGTEDSVYFSIGFRLRADEFIEADGFYFDDLELVVAHDSEQVSAFDLDAQKFSIHSNPNPAGDFLIIEWGANLKNVSQLCVINSMGQEVFKTPVNSNTFRLETRNWQAGSYTFFLSAGNERVNGGRFVLVK
jgi:hypothetical protein